MHALASAMVAWFERGVLNECKQWAYVAAKIRRIMYQQKSTGYFWGYEHLLPLLSDHEPLIQWFTSFEVPYSDKGFYSNPKRAAQPSTPDFMSYQVLLALRGEWSELQRRCEHFFEVSPARRKDYFADQRFHLALTQGDEAGMASAILELLDPKLMKRREEADESGYTKWFINTYAVIYTKIAWRHGYQIEVDSPWVPKEWLPTAPLAEYVDPYPFMQQFDIATPINV